jgi:hypothetical protein
VLCCSWPAPSRRGATGGAGDRSDLTEGPYQGWQGANARLFSFQTEHRDSVDEGVACRQQAMHHRSTLRVLRCLGHFYTHHTHD